MKINKKIALLKGNVLRIRGQRVLSAFTLIELIVVITIIAVLTVVGMVNYGSASKKSRDSRRMADLEKIRIALEMVRQVGTTYPSNADFESSLIPDFIQVKPSDPKAGNPDYNYDRLSNYKYILQAKMEDPSSANGSWGDYNYQVTNP